MNIPTQYDIHIRNLADKIVDANVMSQARKIYKSGTGKACTNHAMNSCLRMVVEKVLRQIDESKLDVISNNIPSQKAIDMIVSGVLKGIKQNESADYI